MAKREGEKLYHVLRFLLGPLYKLYYGPKVIGKENIPKEGAIIIAGNHKHTFDQFNVAIATKRPLHYIAKKEYFDGTASFFSDKPSPIGTTISKWLIKTVGCISVDRSKKDIEATEQALDILKNEGAIGLFPEGTRNKTDAFLLPFKFGVVSMASKSEATIVPFGVTGKYKFRSKDLMIRFGKPFKIGKMTLEEANKKLEEEVSKLMKKNIK